MRSLGMEKERRSGTSMPDAEPDMEAEHGGRTWRGDVGPGHGDAGRELGGAIERGDVGIDRLEVSRTSDQGCPGTSRDYPGVDATSPARVFCGVDRGRGGDLEPRIQRWAPPVVMPRHPASTGIFGA
jgi:hypothetical protein